ncbi:STAS domain-containing protein [Methylocystis sp. H62]|uniref:STAS domain-containing protein n=1 Tax=Methylocystis sp. H62 TaxID=2785789 RepID=UPI001FEEDFA3|nr:STAS domain-containing protein [Methylocystis sp. H62]
MTDMQNGRTVVSVREERLEAHNSNELKDLIHKILEDGAHNLIVDLGQVQFIDSSGLGALLSGYKNANLRAHLRWRVCSLALSRCSNSPGCTAYSISTLACRTRWAVKAEGPAG